MAARKKNDQPVDWERLDELSLSELVELARRAGIVHASRQLPERELIDLLLGAQDLVEDPLAEIRAKTYRFLQDSRRSILASAMDCDLFCPGCPHDKVVECYTDNLQRVNDHQPPED